MRRGNERTAAICPLCGETYHFRRGGWAQDTRDHLARKHPDVPLEKKLRALQRMRPRPFVDVLWSGKNQIIES